MRSRPAAGRPHAKAQASAAPAATRLRFESARFAISVAEPDAIRRASLAMAPEAAFVGRSNAGKSSVLNALVGQRRLAFSSRTPGRTQLLNFFALRATGAPADEETPAGYLVDLPGYGYARIDDATRERWDLLIARYLQERRMLRALVVVMDARHPWMPGDRMLVEWLWRQPDVARLRLHFLLNKADKLTRSARALVLREARQALHTLGMPATVQLHSATALEGVDELRAFLDAAMAGLPLDAARAPSDAPIK